MAAPIPGVMSGLTKDITSTEQQIWMWAALKSFSQESFAMATQTWDTDRYQSQHSFVWHYGQSLIEILDPQPQEQILDLGCGTGQLTQQIAERGAITEGIDADPTMIAQAQNNFPHLNFRVAEAQQFTAEMPCDAVFSNAVLHWIPEPDKVIRSVFQALKPGGRFVAEFGGQGNVQTIIKAVESVLGQPNLNFWYFPSIATYTTLLENQGFEVTYAVLLDRPTPLKEGDKGMANWLKMFGNQFFKGLSTAEIESVLRQIETILKPQLYQNNGWIADYRRLRVIAKKTRHGFE